MKKIYLLSAALLATAAMGQNQFGITRSVTIPEDLTICAETQTVNEDGTVSYGTSKASGNGRVALGALETVTSGGVKVEFVKGSDARLNPAKEATETSAATVEGQATDLRFYLQGNMNGVTVADNTTFCSKANDEENANAKDENMWVGVQYTVPAGVTMSVDAFTFLGAYGNSFQHQFELVDGEGNILWQTKAGEPFKVQSYNQAFCYGDSCHITTEHVSGLHDHCKGQLNGWGTTDESYYEGKLGDNLATTLIPAGFQLTEGTYTLKVYYWKDGPKQWTPVKIVLEGKAEAAAADSKLWKVTEALEDGATITDVDGVTCTWGAGVGTASLKEYAGTCNGEEFTAFMTGSVNPTPGKGATPEAGTFIMFEIATAGTLDVYVQANGGKKIYVLEDGTAINVKLDGTEIEPAYAPEEKVNLGMLSFPVKEGSVYHVYCDGSKIGFFGFGFAAGGAGIEEVAVENAARQSFNLMGQKVANVKGFGIQNGKLIFVK